MKFNDAEKNAYNSVELLLAQAKVPFNRSVLKRNLAYHVDFPSMAAVADILSDINIPNLATRLSPEQLNVIPLPAIVHLVNDGEGFSTVKSITDGYIEYSTIEQPKTWRKEPINDFVPKWDGIALLIEPNENSKEPNFETNRRKEIVNQIRYPFVVIAILILAAVVINTKIQQLPFLKNLPYYLLLAVKFIGTIVCILLSWYGIDQENKFLKSVCSIQKASGCSTVLSSKQAKPFFWISWAEIGLLYFSGTLLFLIIYNDLNVVFVLTCFALPYTIWSLYSQAVVFRDYCILCVTIQILIWVEFMISIQGAPLFNFRLISAGLQLLVCFLPTAILWISMKHVFQKYVRLEDLERSFYKLKFDPGYLSTLVGKRKRLPPVFQGMKSIHIGNENASHTLKVIANPTCSACAKNHLEIDRILSQNKDINCEIFLAANPYENETADLVAKAILSLPDNQQRALALTKWFEKPNYKRWSTEFSYPIEKSAEQALEISARWLNLAGITHAPTIFLDDIEYPDIYTIDEVQRVYYHLQPTDLQIN